ncbi:acyl carrier protein [Chitinophaga solisilvae]|uniref:Acyl carrier protein n=1 Tax=Chitinophaga solisilvae TaxID=1233460 RepID=A0A3S1BLP3_9BACT|nr:phosphopantetheine-binding protein [Chitinophaga solisilvae]NSL90777.1 acyl carrier protein [Chitinophaga solisilvae]
MDRTTLLATIREVVTPYAKNQEALQQLNEDTDFIKDLKINSANLVDVILDVEEKFNIIIDNESMEKMINVKAAIDIVESKLAGS